MNCINSWMNQEIIYRSKRDRLKELLRVCPDESNKYLEEEIETLVEEINVLTQQSIQAQINKPKISYQEFKAKFFQNEKDSLGLDEQKSDDLEIHKSFRCEKKTKLTAVVDWLKLQMTVDPNYRFSHPSKKFQDIRYFLKKFGINSDARVDQCKSDINTYTFDIHDIATGKQFNNILDLLRAEYRATNIKICTLELSLDFWNVEDKGFLLDLVKSVRVSSSVKDKDFRAYRSKTECKKMPKDKDKAVDLIDRGFTIGIGHRDKDDLYIRAYFKTTDHNEVLPVEQHRIRIESKIQGQTLIDMGNEADNLRTLVNEGFKKLQFTKLSESATEEERNLYSNTVQLFGREAAITSKSRNKRNLLEFIKPNKELNDSKRKAVSNLVRNF